MSADKLAEALRNELLRRKVTGLPSKVKLSEQLGLTSFEEVNGWMVKAADDFEAAANEYLEQHEAEKQEPVAWAITYDGKTPHVMWPFGNAGIDAEIKRIGGSASKMALYLSPQQEIDRLDSERLDWIAERLQDVEIDGADPTACFTDANGEDEPWPVLWRRAIDAAKEAKP